MDYAMPVAWEGSRRGFWTRRKRAATSLLVVLALLAGLAVAFKLFDKTVGNNVVRDAAVFSYEVWKWDPHVDDVDAGGAPVYVDTATGTPVFVSGKDTFPGDTRTVDVKVNNTNVAPERDASFSLHVSNIRVTKCENVGNDSNQNNDFNEDGSCRGVNNGDGDDVDAVPPTINGAPNTDWNKFVNYWTLGVRKEKILVVNGRPVRQVEVNEDDHSGQNTVTGGENPDESGNRQYVAACAGAGLKSFTAGAPCRLGLVRQAGAVDALGAPLDSRYYKFDLTQIDDGSNQTAFRGWSITFDLVFAAQVPALPESAEPVSER